MKVGNMKLIGSVYKDGKGELWLISQQKLPKNKGEYKFWTAESLEGYIVGDKELKADSKKQVLYQIENN